MSLRAIQKRDRNKLSSAQQKQQQQQQQQLFINKSRNSFGTSTTTAPLGIGLSSSVGGHHQHRQQSASNSNNKNEKWRNSSSQASLSSSTSIPSAVAVQQLLTHAKRSVSYPSLQKRGSTHSAAASLRFTKSESDLYCGRGAASAVGQPPGGAVQADLSSTNNLYLGAKSEVCLKTLAVKSTHQPPAPFRRQSVSGNRGGNRMYESNRRTSDLGPGVGGGDKLSGIVSSHGGGAVRIPIIGYEVMEERARFTIFKLRIENSISHTCWLVLRRYTDFVRLHNRLRVQFPHYQLVLPRKKWFGDNFSSGFIDNRIQGLQTFINTILEDDAMRTTPAVREFFCLDEPPAYSESMEESRIIFEAQEETISHLKQQLQTKDELVAALQAKLASEINRNKVLTSVIRNSFENCSKCAKQLDNHLKDAAYK